MLVKNGEIRIGEMVGCTPSDVETGFRDTNGNYITLSNKTIIRLYDLLKHDLKRKNISFKKYTENLFKDDNK